MSRKESKVRKVVRESEWLRVEQRRPNLRREISKIANKPVSPKRVRELWPTMSPQEKLDLCAAYHSKLEITKADEEVLDLLMNEGDESVWSSIASVLTRHTDKQRVILFLRERIDVQEPPIANFLQALEILGAKDSVPQVLSRMRGFEADGASPDNPNRLLNIDYLYCSSALWKLTESADYRSKVERFLAANDEVIRSAAKRILSRLPSK